MERKLIHLEDQGQDLLILVIENDLVVEERPFNRNIFIGGYVPGNMLKVGSQCPMHKLPHIDRGYLKYKVVKIEDDNKGN